MYEDYLRFLTSNPEVAESYETLLNNLHLLNSTRPLNTMLLTSTQPEEGKTTVAVNLALTMVLEGKKTLIVDADLRKPRIHRIFKLDNRLGLADLSTCAVAAGHLVQSVEIRTERRPKQGTLSVVTSGMVSANPLSAIGSAKLKEAMEYFRNAYDAVLLDSSPVLSVSDALLLAPMVDGVILVLNTGVVTESDAKRTKERLGHAGGHILGVVMNRFNERLHGPGFHPYFGYYQTPER